LFRWLLRAAVSFPSRRGGRVPEETHDSEEIMQRVAALAIGKAS
jgi:hypothetical protein